MSYLVENGKDSFLARRLNYIQTCVKRPYKTDIFLAFQTGGCLLLHESSVESSCYTTIIQQ